MKIDLNNIKIYLKKISQEEENFLIIEKIRAIKKFINWLRKKRLIEEKNGRQILRFIQKELLKLKIKYFLTKIPFLKEFIFSPQKPEKKFVFNEKGLGIEHYLAFSLLLIFMAGLGAGLYNQFFKKAETPFAYPLQPIRGGRMLSFQGRLTDSLGNPITTSTNVQFRLWKVASGGNEGTCSGQSGEDCLYKTGSCVILPDQDGIFSVLIGQECGGEIPNSVFTENANVYLGVTVGTDSEMTPRQQIANVGYAINAETLQGLPPGTTTSTIPYINKDGNLLIAVANPAIRSTYTSASFTISSANTAILQSAGTGDVILQATESGSIKLRTGGDTDANNRLVISNTGVISIPSLTTGVVQTNASGQLSSIIGTSGYFPKWSATGLSTTSSIYENASGNVGIGTTNPGTKLDIVSGGQRAQFLVGTNSSSYTFQLGVNDDGVNFSNNSVIRGFNFKNANGTLLTITSTGNVGIGTTNPSQKLSVAGTLGILETGASPQYYTIFQGGDQSANITYTLPTSTVDNGFLQYTSGGQLQWTTSIPVTSVKWNNITSPDDNQSLSMSSYNTSWSWTTGTFTSTWGSSTGANNLFNLTDSANNTGTGYLLNVYTASGSNLKPLRIAAKGTEALMVDSNGNIGVGTTNPSSFKLQVAGNVGPDANNTYDLGSSSLRWNNIYGNNLNASGTITFSGLTASRAVFTSSGGQLTTSGTSQYLIDSLSDETGTGYLVFNTSPSFTTSVLTGSTSFSVFNTTATTINAFGAATTLTMGATSGTVTINNTTISLPNATALNIGGDSATLNFSSTTGVKQITTGGTTNLALMPGGNVGIGTTTPSDKLHVAGRIITGISGVSQGVLSILPSTGGSWFNIYNAGEEAGTTLRIAHGGWPIVEDLVSIKNDGNVGIGTTAPASKLSVLSSSNIAPSLTYRSPALFSFDQGSVELAGGTDTVNPWAFWLQTRQSGNIAWPLVLNPLGGNVGIGTNSPSARLEVQGSEIGNTILRLKGVANQTAPFISVFNSSNSELLTLNAEGNLGIGTTSPSKKLHVEGECVAEDSLIPVLKIQNTKCKNQNDNEKCKIFKYVPIKDVKPGDYVLSLNEKTGNFEWQKVEKTLDKGWQQVYEVITETGKRIETTGNHPYLARKKENSTAGASTWEFSKENKSQKKNNQEQPPANNYPTGQIVKINHSSSNISSILTANPMENIANEKESVNNQKLSTVKGRIKSPAPTLIRSEERTFKWEDLRVKVNRINKIIKEKKEDFNQAYWLKVIYLKEGDEIYTLNGWEKIVKIRPNGKKHVYDLQIANTHNFVANGIVAHNTYLNGQTTVGGHLLPSSNNSYDLGSSSYRWRNLYYSGSLFGPESGISGYWQRNSQALSPTYITDDVLLGATATSSALIRLPGTSNQNVWFNTGGNVGIGTTNPSSKLEVRGSTSDNIASALNITNSSGTSLFYVRNDGKIGIGTNNPDSNYTVTIGKNDGSSYGVLINRYPTSYFSGSPGLRIADYVTSGPSSGADGAAGGLLNVGFPNLEDSSSNSYYASLVNIFTSSGSALKVSGNRNVFIGYESSYYFQSSSENLFVEGKVGIGFASPSVSAVLNIYEPNVSSSLSNFTTNINNAGILITTNYSDNTYTPGIFWNTSNNYSNKPKAGIWLSQHSSGTKLYLGTSNTYSTGITNQAITIDWDGNVGIGTTGPNEKLSVAGNIWIGGSGMSGYGGIIKSGTYPFETYLHYTDDGTGYGPAWIHTNTQTGNTVPTMFLQTSGDGANLRVNKAIGIGPMTVTLGSYPSITTNIWLDGSGGNSYFATGNVGIGTTSPAQKLHVEGQCVTGDTLLSIVPSDTNVAQKDRSLKSEVQIKDVKPGTLVYSLNEKTGKIEPAKIKRLLDMGIKPVFKLKTKSGKEIKTTGNHPYLVKLTYEEYQRRVQLRETQSLEKEYGLSQGSLSDTFEFSQTRTIWVDRSITSSINFNPFEYSGRVGSVSQEGVSSVSLSSSRQSLRGSGLSQVGTGTQVSNYTTSQTTSSANSRDQKDALKPDQLSEEILWQKVETSSLDGSLNFQNQRWVKVIYLQPGDLIATISFDLRSSNSQPYVVWDKIQSIEYVGEEQVYDIEVEGTHNFVANGILAHNTYISGNVGIGTTAPVAKLHITGGNVLVGGYGSGSEYGILFSPGDLGSYHWMAKLAGGKLQIGLGNVIGSSPQVTIDNLGNVGIGTTGPEYKLDILGDLRIPYGNAFRVGSSSFSNNVLITTGWDNTLGQDFVKIYTVGAGANNAIPKITILRDGNVGIGTTAPESRLNVVTSDTLTSALSISPYSWNSFQYLSYRVPITIQNNSGSAKTKAHIPIILNTASLISAGKMKSDCSDIRFTDEDKYSPLFFWLEAGCNTTNTIFWVKIPFLPAGSKTIYAYYHYTSIDYGNKSNIQLTFEKGENFDDNVLDVTQFSYSNPVGSFTETGGKLRIDIPSSSNADWWGGALEYAPVASADDISSLGDFIATVKVESYTVIAGSHPGMALWLDRNNAYLWGRLYDGTRNGLYVEKIVNDVGYQNVCTSSITTLPIWLRIRRIGTTYYFDYSTDGLSYANLCSISSLEFTPNKVGVHGKKWTTSAALSINFDNFYIGNYVDSVNVSVGAEQTTPANEIQPKLYVDKEYGYIGIGTKIPQANLELASGTGSTITLEGNYLTPIRGSIAATNGSFRLLSTGSVHVFLDSDNNDIDDNNNAFVIGKNASYFSPNFVELFRVASSGNVGIGTANPAAKLDVNQTGSQTTAMIRGNGGALYTDWPSGWGGGLATWDVVGASTYFSNYITRSDFSKKENIKELPYGLSEVIKLHPVTFTWKKEFGDNTKINIGFIAQEVEKIIPELVTGEEGNKGIQYDRIGALLTKAIQEIYYKIKGIETTEQGNVNINSGNVGIGTTTPTNILTIAQNSPTDPIADAWTTYSTPDSKIVLGTADDQVFDYLEKFKNLPVFKWKRNEKEQERLSVLATPDTPAEILAYDAQGNIQGIDLQGYIGFLHEVMKGQQLQISSLSAQLNDLSSNLEPRTSNFLLTSTGDLQIIKPQNEYVYDGNLDNQSQILNLKSQIYNLKLKTGEIIDRIGAFAEIVVGKIKSGLIETENIIINNTLLAKNIIAENINLTTENLTIAGKKLKDYITQIVNQTIDQRLLSFQSEKIISPVIETDQINLTSQISKLKTTSQNSKLEITDNQNQQVAEFKTDEKETILTGSLEVKSDQNKGKLAQIILKGLEGKTAASIDAAGNASFSGRLSSSSFASDLADLGNLNVHNNATISGALYAAEASVSGKLVAKEIESENLNSLTHQLVNTKEDINEIQKLLADIKNQSLPNLNNQTNLSNITDLTNLTITGHANLYQATITNSLAVGNLFLENDKILSLSWELNLSALSKINFFDGAVTIAKDGTITTKGKIIAQGGIQTPRIILDKDNPLQIKSQSDETVASFDHSGSVFVKRLELEKFYPASLEAKIVAPLENFKKNGIFAYALETASSSAGIGMLPENSQEIIIYNKNVKKDSLVYITPVGYTTLKLSVAEKNDGYFRVITDQMIHPPIKFDWLIIN